MDKSFFKVDIQYLQKTTLLVKAETPERAKELVEENVLEGTEQFAVVKVYEPTEDELDDLAAMYRGFHMDELDAQDENPKPTLN